MPEAPKPTAPTVLAAGGLAAAFAAASCCALPLALGALGLGSAWLAGVAAFAAPLQPLFLLVAIACLVGGIAIWWRRRSACAADGACARPRLGRFAALGFAVTGALTLAAILSG